LLLLGAAIAGRAAHANTRSRELEPWRIERDGRRFEILNTGALWDLLAIRPGMTILDIGTGTGQFAYAFAERLQGRGRVYATDINDSCVRYVKEQAGARGLTNIVPALVQRGGVDAFYRTDTYNLVALFHVSIDFEKEVDFLSDLKSSLAKDGRLVLMIAKEFPDFSGSDFEDDDEGLAQAILREPLDSPFYRAVREATRELLRTSLAAGDPEGLRKAVAAEFNGILANANFGMAFFEGSAFRKELDFTTDERAYADWLTIPNNIRNAAEGVPHATWISGRRVRMVNKLLIVQHYRRFLKNSALYASGLSPAGREAFARAGYVLHREYSDLIPFEDVLVYGGAH
jgi:SAM-dependent methyltransferase